MSRVEIKNYYLDGCVRRIIMYERSAYMFKTAIKVLIGIAILVVAFYVALFAFEWL